MLIVPFFFIHNPRNKTEHYADELEDELAEAMLSDFGAQLEDDSPREVRE